MSYATTPSKTVDTTVLLAWQDIATGAQAISADVSVSTKRAITFGVKIGRRSGSAFTAGWPNVRFEFSLKSTGNDNWQVLYPYQAAVGASIANTTLSAGPLAGATTFTVTSATNIAVGDWLYLGDTTITNSELVRVKGVSGTTITPEDALTNAHANGSAVTDQAEAFSITFGCSTFTRMRVVVDNAGSGQTVAVEVRYTTYDYDLTQ